MLAGAALLLVAVSVGGTLAWLTDSTEKVENTFTKTDLKIILDESEDKWEKALLPGATYQKDPYVEVAKDSVAAWVFVEIVETNNKIGNTEEQKVSFTPANGWVKVGAGDHEGGTVYLYKTKALTNSDGKVYVLSGEKNGQVTVSGNVTEADMAALPTLTFYAYAVQSENLTINNVKIDAANIENNMAAVWALHASTPVANP